MVLVIEKMLDLPMGTIRLSDLSITPIFVLDMHQIATPDL